MSDMCFGYGMPFRGVMSVRVDCNDIRRSVDGRALAACVRCLMRGSVLAEAEAAAPIGVREPAQLDHDLAP